MTDQVWGVDVANYQKYPDWNKVRDSGKTFGITKASEGNGYVNETFRYNWQNMLSAGVLRGAYHFARPDKMDPEAEARFFFDTVDIEGLEPGDFLALDLENREDVNSFANRRNGITIGDYAVRFLAALTNLAGFRPFLYTAPNVINEHALGQYTDLHQYGLWLATYYYSEQPYPIPKTPGGWDFIAMWQYSSSGAVPGIEGAVDLNVFQGSRDMLLKYGKPGTLPPERAPFEVGDALAKALAANNDTPAHEELFFVNKDGSPAYSMVHGTSGRPYTWLPKVGQVFIGGAA